jgi:hypothetical protein
MRRHLWLLMLTLFAVSTLAVAAAPASAAKRALFDNAHAETAGNADWVIDSHQPTPSPAQSGITAGTTETFWVGAISAWGVALVKQGYTVTTNTAALTYGNTGNPQDLANFDVLVIDEPNTLFSAAEATAILNFVHDGGGLVAISDHSGSDRNSDGQDSPMIWNALDPTHVLGVHFGVVGDANNNIVQTSTNVNAAASDSITHGPLGTVTGEAYHNGTTMTLFPGTNPTVRGEIWMTGLAQSSTTGVMAASAQYGSGRVFFTGDSSPADDGTASAGNTVFNGWDEAGASDGTLFLNATLWASRRAGGGGGDVTAPVVTITAPTGGQTWKAGSSQSITWTATDNVGVSSVDIAYSTDGGATYPNAIATAIANSGSFAWSVPNITSTTARVRVQARDAAGNVGTGAIASNFTIDKWTITASAGANGTISPVGAVSVAQGGSQAFTITANTGFHVSDVAVDGISAGAVTTFTFSNVTANHTIAASFAANSSFTITASAGANGTIAPSGAVVVTSGANQTFTIAANAGFHIAGVTVDGAAVGAVSSYTFTNVLANHTISTTYASGTNAPYPMASGNYSETFADIANWTNNFAAGIGAAPYASVPVEGTAAIPDGFHTTTSTATFTTATSGGVQKGTGNIQLLSTGTTDNSTAVAIDLLLDFTRVTAGTLSYDWATVFNSTGDRKGSLRVYTSTDGVTFTELTAADALNFTNNVAGSGHIGTVALPAAFTGSASARIRFYYHNGVGGTTGSRPKVSIDNVAVTGTLIPGVSLRPATEESPLAVTAFALSAAPNPAQHAARFALTSPQAGEATLQIYDLSGRHVATAFAGRLSAGTTNVAWDLKDAAGTPVRGGLYFARLTSGARAAVTRLVVAGR